MKYKGAQVMVAQRQMDLPLARDLLTGCWGAHLEPVDEDLSGVEHLLSQSLKGFHFVFDKQDIKHALGSPLNGIAEFEYENKERVQEVFLEFIKCKTLTSKQDHLQKISAVDKELLIKTYFNILENTLKKCSTLEH